MHPGNISILDFTYALPQERIASFPSPNRDDAKLLLYQSGEITEDNYRNIAHYLPDRSLLVFNNTRVIQARILFQKPTGGVVEIFCLEPFEPVKDYSIIMRKKACIHWKCMIGGASKWKEGNLEKKVLTGEREFSLFARLVEKLPDAYVVELSWQPSEISFAEIIEQMGDTPLPPYIKRDVGEADKERYQTIYAQHEGSVAAPTAGLHFTEDIFSALRQRSISNAYVTLHVGAGTFKPVKATTLREHEMHAEWMEINADVIYRLIEHIPHGIIAVGTTSLRTIESLYWMGVKTFLSPAITLAELPIKQWEVYDAPLAVLNISPAVALNALLKWMERSNLEQLIIQTQLLIAPAYSYKLPAAIITNFHQPQSTLLLLVAAAIGDDWRKVYDYALENNFRFLSYGDGSLLFLHGKSLSNPAI